MVKINDFLNKITMYRLLIYYLGGLLAVAFVLALFGNLGFNPFALLVAVGVLVTACWSINRVFAALFHTPANHESSVITALILALLITPSFDTYGILFLLAAAGLAMASKYILTIKNVHVFNPAAIALVVTAFAAGQSASWWVGTAVMLPFVVAGGVLVVHKIRRWPMVLSFFVTAFLTAGAYAAFDHNNVIAVLQETALASPVFFLGLVMLTEPLTSPATKNKQVWFGAVVGALVPPQVHVLGLYSSPELALVIGNIFAYGIEPRVRVWAVLTQKVRVAASSIDFVLSPGRQFTYKPGQYMEWTLPHAVIDDRGNRRYFTLASSPTEPTVRLGVKFYDQSSSFKQAMLGMTLGTPIIAAQVAGDFVLPRNDHRKLAFIAGGIGVTPFRSMTKYLLDTNQHRDVAMLYAAHSVQEVAYADLFERARQQFGMRTTYVIADPGGDVGQHVHAGYVDAAAVQARIPDYLDRLFYVSGSHTMVVAVRRVLVGLGVPRRHIKTDFFSGYV